MSDMNPHDISSSLCLPAGVAALACVDIGGTKIAVSIADARGLHSRLSEATVKVGTNNAVALQVIRMVQQSCQLAGIATADLGAVGVSSCGPFARNGGMLELAAPNICAGISGQATGQSNQWQTAPLEAPLRQALGNVSIENDGVAALQAERRWGALQHDGQAFANCAYVTWSTGIGMGLCVDGHILRGKNGNAGHGGHLFVSDGKNALCGCGNVGDVESLIAGGAIERRFGPLGYTDASTLLQAASAGESSADSIAEELCRVMGRALYNIIVLLDLERISIGGGVFWKHREFLLPKLHRHIRGKMTALTDHCQLVPAGLGERVGDFGALALILPERAI